MTDAKRIDREEAEAIAKRTIESARGYSEEVLGHFIAAEILYAHSRGMEFASYIFTRPRESKP